jgi:hypothetical protein
MMGRSRYPISLGCAYARDRGREFDRRDVVDTRGAFSARAAACRVELMSLLGNATECVRSIPRQSVG